MFGIRRMIKCIGTPVTLVLMTCGLTAQADETCETEIPEILAQTRSVLLGSDDPPLIDAVRNASAAKNGCAEYPEALAAAVEVYNLAANRFEGDGNKRMLYGIGLETALMRESLVAGADRDDEARADYNGALTNIVRQLLILSESGAPHEIFLEDVPAACPYSSSNNYRVRIESAGLLDGLNHTESSASVMYDLADHRLAALAEVCTGHQRYATESRAMLYHHRARALAREGDADAQRDALRLAASFMNASLSMESEGHYAGTVTRVYQEIQDELAGRN